MRPPSPPAYFPWNSPAEYLCGNGRTVSCDNRLEMGSSDLSLWADDNLNPNLPVAPFEDTHLNFLLKTKNQPWSFSEAAN